MKTNASKDISNGNIFFILTILKTKVYYLAATFQTVTFAMRSRAAVARRAHNPKVLGSIPSFATKEAQQCASFLVLPIKGKEVEHWAITNGKILILFQKKINFVFIEIQ